MGLELNVNISVVTVFIQGLLSFFSPCILPVIPLYIGYLSGGATKVNETGEVSYDQKKVLIHTSFFIIGISCAFYILGMGFSSMGQFLSQHQSIITKIGGVIIIVMGIIQLGLLKKIVLIKDYRLPIKLDPQNMNPLTALLMGFTFSFAWTPCVGPALSSVLIMISTSQSSSAGMFLMGVYTLGFILPFLFLGVFTTRVLNFFKNNVNIVQFTVKIGAVVMILIGVLMYTGQMNELSIILGNTNSSQTENNEENEYEDEVVEENTETTPEKILAPEIELIDQYGVSHKLSDYEGKAIFLNFWATWCPPCVSEMPDIQNIYEQYGYNNEDVIILGVAMPNDENSYTREGSVEMVSEFLKENEYTYPVLMDMDGSIAAIYGITSYPTTFLIAGDGSVFGYIPGMIDMATMIDAVEQTLNVPYK